MLQIMKKCVELPAVALCLIKKYGLISWFSSILLFYGKRLAGKDKEFSLAVIEFVLKVRLCTFTRDSGIVLLSGLLKLSVSFGLGSQCWNHLWNE